MSSWKAHRCQNPGAERPGRTSHEQQLTDRVYAINLHPPVYDGTVRPVCKGRREGKDSASAWAGSNVRQSTDFGRIRSYDTIWFGGMRFFPCQYRPPAAATRLLSTLTETSRYEVARTQISLSRDNGSHGLPHCHVLGRNASDPSKSPFMASHLA